jgi:tetratricopeptide (TPR) repeat protein
MIFEHERSFIKQIIIYFKAKEYDKACELGEQFVEKFPSAMMSHYLLAKACYWRRDFITALTEGHKALNMAEARDDLVATAIFLASVYYELKRFTRGYEVLSMVEHLEDERIEKALFVLSLCKSEPETAMMHVDALYRINHDVAESFVDKALHAFDGFSTPH